MSSAKATDVDTQEELLARIAALEGRLAEAEETLRAIRTGEVDALVVSGPEGDHIFALEGADHAYRMLVEEMQEGTVTLDPDGLILYSNRQFAAMMRAPVETVVGSRFNRFLDLERPIFFSEFVRDIENRRKRLELTLFAADGAPLQVQVSLNRLETGGIQTICVVITDLTEQRHYESMVKDGELSRLILDQAAEAIVVIDAQGKILRASESARQLAQRSILFEGFDAAFQLWGPEHRVDTSHLLSAALSDGGLRSLEVQLIVPGRPSSALLLSMGPLWGGSHELLGCVVTLTDITGRKRSEEALARQAQALERSNNDLRQFAYAASHDLREPIRTLVIYNQLFEAEYKHQLSEQADALIQRTVAAAHRLEALLDDLLVYIQVADAPQSRGSVVDANEVLTKTLANFGAAFAETGAKIESDRLPALQVDEVHLQQLFQNLLSNSLKYRAGSPLHIRIAARRDANMWRLGVADNGIGIAQPYHEQIFGLFKRLHGQSKYVGSGMGLAICQRIVERYGGRIWVESEEGKGSAFFFTLPGSQS